MNRGHLFLGRISAEVPDVSVRMRVYEATVEGDGLRVLVDRLWPRDLSKETAQIEMGRVSAALRR